MKHRSISIYGIAASLALALACISVTTESQAAATTCPNGGREVTANVVVIDQPLMFNRLGAGNVNGMVYALKRDVVNKDSKLPLTAGGSPVPGNVELRPDKRPRPLTLRVAAGDCLTVNLTNLLFPTHNPNPAAQQINLTTVGGQLFTVGLDEQPLNRWVGFHAAGMQMVTGIYDDGSIVGQNPVLLDAPESGLEGGLVSPGKWTTYKLYAEKAGVYLVTSEGVTVGSDGNEGHIANGLFGQVIVEPKGARIYRGQVFEEELRLALDTGNVSSCTGTPGYTCDGHPILNYEALYPALQPWIGEGKAGLPVLNMITAGNEIVHSEINAVVAGPDPDGTWKLVCSGGSPGSPATGCPYPLESVGKRNPTVPNRLEPFRDFSSQFHDETANGQAFPGWYNDDVFKYVLEGVKDAFMINYGSGGIGSEIIANRLGVGPMFDCLDCAYEEFFLTSYAVGDPAMLVDVPANLGLELCDPNLTNCAATGPKANWAIGAEDPANIHHSYTGDFTKFNNTHVGKEQHVFHLHNHQWLYNPNDENSNYLDAQGIGPGAGYTYEINFGGSGNRNKSAGDSIFHCHFYPHFAQGMWYHWRHHDVTETGTLLAASVAAGKVTVPGIPGTFHGTPWALANTTPAPGARALPDAEILAGTPIPAVVPLPGKPMAPMPGNVATVKPNPNTVCLGAKGGGVIGLVDKVGTPPACPAGAAERPTGSLADVRRENRYPAGSGIMTGMVKNPGYPFWVAGIEDIVGQRPTTPPLDMLSRDHATALKGSQICANASNEFVALPDTEGNCPAGTAKIADPLWAQIVEAQADGWDGGLPRHALEGLAAAKHTAADPAVQSTQNRLDFSKTIKRAKPVYYPEEGTDLEQAAMAFHAVREHSSWATKLDRNRTVVSAQFVTNGGGGPVVGAPYHNPCIDDLGNVLSTGVTGAFFSGENLAGMSTAGSSIFTSDSPRIYKGTFIQFDAVLNKVGYHYPQQRIVTLWQDAAPTILRQKAAEPLVFRFNTFDCMVYHNSNLVPEVYELDDYQVRTPTDIIGQHIHLPKWDLTTTDGSGNGWNYEDGTLSPKAVQERIHAINKYNTAHSASQVLPLDGRPTLEPLDHPYFGKVAKEMGNPAFIDAWLGARTTTQRWFSDPVVNVEGVDRGLGIIFTHDHYGPSTHQQIGLYSTALTEPAGSRWVHNETGVQLGDRTKASATTATPGVYTLGDGGRFDGGPTSWQAAILPPALAPGNSTVKSETIPAHREFYFEFSDFQHAYEAGVYVGAGRDGLPLAGTGQNLGPQFAGAAAAADTFRFAINPPARAQIAPVFPDLVLEVAGGVLPGCPTRPCPQAISVQDPGVHVVNYRQEPVGLRVYDPLKLGPDGKPGAQADGKPGDLAYALSTKIVNPDGTTAPITRAIAEMNQSESVLMPWGAKPLNMATAVDPNDPFTPMLRAYTGDLVRVKIQAGGHEEEHNATIHGMKWLQAGSGNGRAPNSGWRNAQAAGISEQFTLSVPNFPAKSQVKGLGFKDYAYSMDTSMDGWWSGMWGIFRSYDAFQTDLIRLPNNNVNPKPRITNAANFAGVCPANPTTGVPLNLKTFNVVAILANDLLADRKPAGTVIKINPDPTLIDPGTTLALNQMHNGGPLKESGGTLVYNPRGTTIPPVTLPVDGGGTITIGDHAGPIHDPTAILYVRLDDLTPVTPALAACKDAKNRPGVVNPTCPVRLKDGVKAEPLVLRANAGDCVEATLWNRLPQVAPDLPTFATLQGVVKRDRNHVNAGVNVGSTTFNNNLIRPSSTVGLHAQLVAMDVTQDDGTNVGQNFVQTVAPVDAAGKLGKAMTYRWYVGDVSAVKDANGVKLVATPVEFGGTGLIPADKVKQGQKSLVGALVALPQGSTITQEDSGNNFKGSGHAAATVQKADGTIVRDFMLVMTKNQNHRYADGFPVEHMNGEGVGLPEDSQESSNMALNYGIEPLWFRFGIPPNAPFGGAGCNGGTGCYGNIPNAHMAYSNKLPVDRTVAGSLEIGDPATPVFTAKAGQETRMHVAVPHSTSRGSTLAIHGHVWQRDPYVCPGDSGKPGTYGLPGKCEVAPNGGLFDSTGQPLVGSRALGVNPIGFYQGGQESLTSHTHFDFFLPKAGGGNEHPGDYLFRDGASFGNASGLWGILRVTP